MEHEKGPDAEIQIHELTNSVVFFIFFVSLPFLRVLFAQKDVATKFTAGQTHRP